LRFHLGFVLRGDILSQSFHESVLYLLLADIVLGGLDEGHAVVGLEPPLDVGVNEFGQALRGYCALLLALDAPLILALLQVLLEITEVVYLLDEGFIKHGLIHSLEEGLVVKVRSFVPVVHPILMGFA
jgi:hypothetical protein